MNKELLWNLFRVTGKIEYYLQYKKELEKEDVDAKHRNRKNL